VTGRPRTARRTIRYWILRAVYSTLGHVDVPLIGPKGNGKRNCGPGLQAQIDVFGGMWPQVGVNRIGRGLVDTTPQGGRDA
jgi:hypothetical protein